MRFDDRVTGNLKTYAPNAKKIHVDIDPAEFNKNVRVDAAVSGDVGAILKQWIVGVVRFDFPQVVKSCFSTPDELHRRGVGLFRHSPGFDDGRHQAHPLAQRDLARKPDLTVHY